MKKVLYTGSSLIAAAVLALVIMGLFVPEVEYTATVRITASMEEVWQTYTDMEQRSRWLEGFERSEQLSGTGQAVGAQSVHYFEGGNTYTETITAVQAHQHITTEISTDLFTGTVTAIFEDQGDAVRLQQQTVMRGATFYWRAMMPLLKPLRQRQKLDALDRLEDLVEGSPSRGTARQNAP
ncbi:MAG: SRPBCC family protein [Bacteroidota bacterium]|nr:SRPBCC family protein [Bacteroidota bacterium]MDE2835305.1 SRPBCC family protein [Bacteroidota bacterium]MDE2955679.1 SRPBCC family protein [Bacteroidota bacterium]